MYPTPTFDERVTENVQKLKVMMKKMIEELAGKREAMDGDEEEVGEQIVRFSGERRVCLNWRESSEREREDKLKAEETRERNYFKIQITPIEAPVRISLL